MVVSIKDIRQVSIELVGEISVPVIDYLYGKKTISEFIISEELDIEIHQIRHVLYKLYDQNIVKFIRRKDKIKGWYICYWDINEEIIPYLDLRIKESKLSMLKQRLEREKTGTFFMCRNACQRVDFETSFDLDFKCPECGMLLNQQDNTRTIEFLTERINELKTEIMNKSVKYRALLEKVSDKLLLKPLLSSSFKQELDSKSNKLEIKPELVSNSIKNDSNTLSSSKKTSKNSNSRVVKSTSRSKVTSKSSNTKKHDSTSPDVKSSKSTKSTKSKSDSKKSTTKSMSKSNNPKSSKNSSKVTSSKSKKPSINDSLSKTSSDSNKNKSKTLTKPKSKSSKNSISSMASSIFKKFKR